MGYLALYRKYRPFKFDDVIGQNQIIEILRNSIKNNTIGHAYLFNGPRGTGKTSVAKIFARAVNCKNPINGDACGCCDTCLAIKANDIDIIEIDAASNNGVDEIREIRNNVKLVPTIGRFKIYIIDEVHMLSMGAFNALLKTLEEPPEHVVFILATTEIQKLPLTIISRCQRFDFKKISSELIKKLLTEILRAENKDVNEDVLELIAEGSDGGLRDAINLLDQVSSSCESPTIENIYSLNGDSSQKDIEHLFDLVLSKDFTSILSFSKNINEAGKNYCSIVDRMIMLSRNININNNVKDYFDEKTMLRLEKYKNVDNETCLYLAKKLLEISSNIKKSVNQRIMFEISLIDIITNLPESSQNENKSNFSNKNLDIDQKDPCFEFSNSDEIISREIISVRINNVLCGADKEKLKQIKSKTTMFSDYISNKKYNMSSSILTKGNIIVASEKYLMFSYKEERDLNLFLDNLESIEKFILEVFEEKYKIIAVLEEEWKKIKEDYVKNIKNGIQYNLQPEPKIKEKKNKINSSAFDIFGEDSIDVK